MSSLGGNEKLGFSLELNISPYERSVSKAAQGLEKFGKDGKKTVTDLEKEVKSLGEGLSQALDPKKWDRPRDSMGRFVKSVGDANKEVKSLAKEVEALGRQIEKGAGSGNKLAGSALSAAKLRAMRGGVAREGAGESGVPLLSMTSLGEGMTALAGPAAAAAAAVAAIGAAAAAAGAVVTQLSLDLGKWMSGLASEFEQIKGQFDFVFEGMEASATAFVGDLSKEIHRGMTEITKTMAGFGMVFADMEFPVDQAEAFSEMLTRVTFDLSALKNQKPEEISAKLDRALKGSAGAARQLGIDMSKAAVDAELLRMGLEGGAKAASEQDLAVARLNIIMAETANTSSQAASQIETFDGMMVAIAATAEDLGTTFGKEINNAVLEAIKAFGGLETVEQIMRVVLDTAKEITIAVVKLGGMAVNWIGEWIKQMGGAETIHYRVVAAISQIKGAYYGIEFAAKMFAGTLYSVYRSLIEPPLVTMKNLILEIGDSIGVGLTAKLADFARALSVIMHASAKLIPGAWGDSMEETAGEIDQWVGVMDGYTEGWAARAKARAEETYHAWNDTATDIAATWAQLDLGSSLKGAVSAGYETAASWEAAARAAAAYKATLLGGSPDDYLTLSTGNTAFSRTGRDVNYQVQGNGSSGGSGGGGGSGAGGGGSGGSGGYVPGPGNFIGTMSSGGSYGSNYGYSGSTSGNGGYNYGGGYQTERYQSGVQYFASGGLVQGPRGQTDKVPAMLTPGERVLSPEENATYEKMSRGGGGSLSLTVHNHFPSVTKISDDVMERAMAPTFARLRRAGVKI